MKRDYKSGISNEVDFFIGKEIEKTPAYGKITLFVVGLQPISEIETLLAKEDIEHIFFGANHSYNPLLEEEDLEWQQMISYFLKKEFLCSLDIHINQADSFINNTTLCEYMNFIPQLRVPISYINHWNYNTMVKIDDRDFKFSNPGIWTHRLHGLMSYPNFTSWDQYKNDIIVKSNRDE
jgi:hypothetical protein